MLHLFAYNCPYWCYYSNLNTQPCYEVTLLTRIVYKSLILTNSQIREVEYHYFIYICSSTGRDITLGVLYGYKAVLQGATVIMALKRRHVKVRGLNDWQEIITATYLTSFVLVIILIVKYTVEDMINTFAAVTSLSYFIGATAIILLVFVPKVTSN